MSTKHKEYKGKDIDAAIAAACADLKASRHELEIEVVAAGSAGFFGFGKKKAVILAARKDSGHAKPETKPRGEGRPADRPPRPHTKAGKEQISYRDSPKREADSRRHEEAAKPPTPEILDEIKELLQTLLRLMDLPAEVTMSFTGNKVTAHINAENHADDIVGREGGTLDAIQYLLRKIVSQKFADKINLNLNAGNYRQDRQRELEELALEMARKVKESGQSQLSNALNPAERRIVHVTLQDDTGIRSSSVGEGLFKKVRIYLPGQGRKKSGGRGRHRPQTPDESPSA